LKKILENVTEWIRLEKEWWMSEVFMFLQVPPEPVEDEEDEEE
tara:strand:+ start:173 stop:301 length:129 start_codon:yes stop_codon:yes gene_type:complete